MLSIIIVTYNNTRYLNKLLNHLTNIPKSWQVIIIDNNSTNKKTKNILQNFNHQKNFTIIFNPKNIGFGKAVNQAVKLAKGKYLLLLNPDTLITPSQIQSLLDFARKQKHFGAIAPALVSPDCTIQPSVYPLPTLWGAIKEFILGLQNNYLPFVPKTKQPIIVPAAVGACLLIPKTIFNKIKGFDPKYFLYFEDIDLCRKLNQLNLPIWYLPNLKVTHYKGESGNSQATHKLLHQSAQIYFGPVKKTLIDFIIRLGHFIPALLISLILSILKLRIIINTSAFAADQEYLAWQAYKAWLNKDLFLTGMPASIGGFFIAPYYSYLNALIFKLLNFHPFALFITTFVSNFITLIILYYLAHLIIKNRLASFIFMFIFAFSKYSNGLWPVDWLSLSAVLFLVSFLFLFQKHYDKSLLWLSFSFSVGISSHPSYLAFIPFVTILALYLFTHTQTKTKLTNLFIAFTAIAPLIIFDLKHQFYNLRGLLSVFADQQNRTDYIQTTSLNFLKISFVNNYLKAINLPLSFSFAIILISLLSLFFLFKKHQNLAYFFLASIFTSLTLLIGLPFLLTKTVDYYLLYPGILLFFTTWLLFLYTFNFLPSLYRYLALFLISFFIIFTNLPKLTQPTAFSWYYQNQTVQFITQNFDLENTKLSIITQPGHEKGFYYLFEFAKNTKTKNNKQNLIKTPWINLVFLHNWHDPNANIKKIGGYKIYWPTYRLK